MEVLDVKFKIYPTRASTQPVVWMASEMAERHKLAADEIEHSHARVNHLEDALSLAQVPAAGPRTARASARKA